MANEHMKRCSTSLVIRELQIKTSMRNHFIHSGITIIFKMKIAGVTGDVEELELL